VVEDTVGSTHPPGYVAMRIVLVVTLWFLVVVQGIVVPGEIARDLRYGSGAVERVAVVRAHALGPSIATRPGRTFTTLVLDVPSDDGAPERHLLHGEEHPPPIGSELRVRHPHDAPEALRRAEDGLARFHDSLGAVLGLVVAVGLAAASTRGRHADAPPRLRYGPALVVSLGVFALGALGLSAFAFDAQLVETRYRAIEATVIASEICDEATSGRGLSWKLWCSRLRYSVDGVEHTTLGPPRLDREAVGDPTTVRVHPDRPEVVTAQTPSDERFFLGVAVGFAVVGLGAALAILRRWRQAPGDSGRPSIAPTGPGPGGSRTSPELESSAMRGPS
jgi:hypothetical protein